MNHAACPLVDDPDRPFFIAHASNCVLFYSCQRGTASLQSCPQQLSWNQATYSCVPAHTNPCSQIQITTPYISSSETTVLTSPTLPTVSKTSSSENDPTLIPENFDELCRNHGAIFLPYPGNCSKFIQCNGLAFVHECPTNLQWNSLLTTCDRFCK